MGKITGAIYLILLIIGIAGFFFDSPYWMISILAWVLLITMWIVGFTWRIATAADNWVQKYQDKPRTRRYYDPNSWNRPKDYDEDVYGQSSYFKVDNPGDDDWTRHGGR